MRKDVKNDIDQLRINEQARIDEQKKQFAYYSNNKPAIEAYTRTALKKIMSSKAVDKMNFQFVSVHKKIVNQLSTIYNAPAVRYAVKKDGSIDETWTDYLNNVLYPEDINGIDKYWLALAISSRKNPLRIFFDKRTGLIKQRVEPAYKFVVDVDPDDVDYIEVLSYEQRINSITSNSLGGDLTLNEAERVIVIWTETEHYKDGEKTRYYVDGNPDGVNPYGIIPFAWLEVGKADDFWGHGLSDSVSFNEAINLMLCDLAKHENLVSMTLPFFVNCNLTKENPTYNQNNQEELKEGVEMGGGFALIVEGIKNGDQPPSAQYISPDSAINEIKTLVDWEIKLIAIANNLNPNAFMAEVQSTSGYSKFIDSLGELIARNNLRDACLTAEKQRFAILKVINNTHAAEAGSKLKTIPDDIELKVDFVELKPERTQAEIEAQRRFELEFNLSTSVDWLMEQNPDLQRDEAINLIRENKKLNDELIRGKTTIMADINNTNTPLMANVVENNADNNLNVNTQ